jgi:hypothetical protein
MLNLRKFFTDSFEILTQRCIRIRAFFIYLLLRLLESANQTISISAQTMEQQKILYTHKHCEIMHITNVRFLFPFSSI